LGFFALLPLAKKNKKQKKKEKNTKVRFITKSHQREGCFSPSPKCDFVMNREVGTKFEKK
jgi:hypothetical protein